MLALLIKFLESIGDKIIEKVIKVDYNKKTHIKKFIRFFITLNRVHEDLVAFQKFLIFWKEGGYSTFTSYGGGGIFENLGTALKILKDDIDNLLRLEELGLTEDIYGFLNHKISVFRVWQSLISRNDYNFIEFEVDRQTGKRYIYIPNYSFLLSETPSITDINHLFLKEDFLIQPYELEHSTDLLSFIPQIDIETNIEIPFPTHSNDKRKKTRFVKLIVVPDEDPEIEDIITKTGEAIGQLGGIIERLRALLKGYIGPNQGDIFQYI